MTRNRHRGRTQRLLIVLAIALVLGWVGWAFVFAGGNNATYQPTPQYLLGRIKLNTPHPAFGAPRLPQLPTFAPAQASGHINYANMEPTLDQGSVGQCTCEAFRYEFDYLIKRRTGRTVHVSCRFLYSAITGGKDLGSNGWQYPPIIAQVGYVLHRQYDYKGLPTDDQLQYPLPQYLTAIAAGHRYALTMHVISADANAGQPAVNKIEQEISKGRPVMLGMPVWNAGQGQNSMFDVTPWAPYVDVPGDPRAAPLGYHTVTITAFYRNRCVTTNAGTSCGVFQILNQWGPQWGVNALGQPNQSHAGYAYMTYRFVRTFGSEIVAYHLGASNPKLSYRVNRPPPFYQPGAEADKGVPAPPLPPGYRVPYYGAAKVYVTKVYAKDTGQRLDPAINYWAAHYGISPVGLLAVIGAECGLYTTSTTCDHVWSASDDSFGCCQVTVQTASLFGVGNGTFDGYYGPNVSFVRGYENQAPLGIALGAKVLGSYAAYERQSCPPAADFPHLYVAWNAGPAQPCWFLMTPTGQAGSNFYNNFESWMAWAYQYATTTPPKTGPVPRKPFNKALWCSYLVKRHHACISWLYHGKLSWAASVWRHHPRLGGVKATGRWVRRGRFDVYPFAHGYIYAWPRFRSAKVVLT